MTNEELDVLQVGDIICISGIKPCSLQLLLLDLKRRGTGPQAGVKATCVELQSNPQYVEIYFTPAQPTVYWYMLDTSAGYPATRPGGSAPRGHLQRIVRR